MTSKNDFLDKYHTLKGTITIELPNNLLHYPNALSIFIALDTAQKANHELTKDNLLEMTCLGTQALQKALNYLIENNYIIPYKIKNCHNRLFYHLLTKGVPLPF